MRRVGIHVHGIKRSLKHRFCEFIQIVCIHYNRYEFNSCNSTATLSCLRNSVSKSLTYRENRIGDSSSPCKRPLLLQNASDGIPYDLTQHFMLQYI